jgi:hypothetical protein
MSSNSPDPAVPAGADAPPTAPAADAEGPLLGTVERGVLLELARASIVHGLETGAPLPVSLEDKPASLTAARASFVTLHLHDRLRGCIGHLEAVQPLVRDVVENAFGAAFRDPRFEPLTAAELAPLHIAVSVLTPAEPIPCAEEEALLAALCPGRDGVILSDGPHRGTFLPAVWEQLPEPRDFLRQLKQKAGLAPEHWSAGVRAWRYRTERFGE